MTDKTAVQIALNALKVNVRGADIERYDMDYAYDKAWNAAIDACITLLEKPAGDVEGWRPIETASKKEWEHILCFCPDQPQLKVRTLLWIVGYHGGSWRHVSNWGEEFHPTHWMPLPAAPEKGA